MTPPPSPLMRRRLVHGSNVFSVNTQSAAQFQSNFVRVQVGRISPRRACTGLFIIKCPNSWAATRPSTTATSVPADVASRSTQLNRQLPAYRPHRERRGPDRARPSILARGSPAHHQEQFEWCRRRKTRLERRAVDVQCRQRTSTSADRSTGSASARALCSSMDGVRPSDRPGPSGWSEGSPSTVSAVEHVHTTAQTRIKPSRYVVREGTNVNLKTLLLMRVNTMSPYLKRCMIRV